MNPQRTYLRIYRFPLHELFLICARGGEPSSIRPQIQPLIADTATLLTALAPRPKPQNNYRPCCMECIRCGAGNCFVVEDAVVDLHIHLIGIGIETEAIAIAIAIAFSLTRLQVCEKINL